MILEFVGKLRMTVGKELHLAGFGSADKRLQISHDMFSMGRGELALVSPVDVHKAQS